MNIPKTIKSEIVFEQSLIKIRKDRLQKTTSETYDYFSVITPPIAVVILAITPDGFIVTQKEYRHPTAHTLLSLPGGFIEDKENILEAARRELLEETGYDAETFIEMGSAYPYAGFSPQKTCYILAKNAFLKSSPQHEISEIIATSLSSFEDLKKEIDTHPPLDISVCAALFFYQNISLKKWW